MTLAKIHGSNSIDEYELILIIFLISHDLTDLFDLMLNATQTMNIRIVTGPYFLCNLSLTRIDITRSQCEMHVLLGHAQSLVKLNSSRSPSFFVSL